MNNNELLVVGIASSAGGLTPLMEVISNAVCHENMAFVLVPHLSRDHETALPQILSNVSALRILSIQDGMTLEPCHLYVLPPGVYARISDNKFCLDPRPPGGDKYRCECSV